MGSARRGRTGALKSAPSFDSGSAAGVVIQDLPFRRCVLLAAAAFVGAGGLAAEAIQLSASGLALGFGRASALGLAVFVAGYALGSWRAGRFAGSDRRWLLAAGALSLLLPWIGVRAILFASAAGWSTPVSGSIAAAALALCAALQGALLPALLRVDESFCSSRAVALVFAANLAGSVAGARWIGFELVAQFGRADAALAAGATAALGAWIAAAWAPAKAAGRVAAAAAPAGAVFDLSRSQAALLAGLGTAWMIALEWIGLRHALLWLESQQATLSAVLSASLSALAIGALLALILPRGRAGLFALIPCMIAGTWWIASGASFVHSHSAGSRYFFALGLLGPALVAFGAWIPMLYRASSGEVGARLGDLLLHEAWGALIGAALAHALLVPKFGLAGALAGLALLGAALAWIVSLRSRLALKSGVPIAIFSIGVSLALARAEEPALASPLYIDPSLVVRAFAEDAQFAVGVVDDGIQGERTLLTDRFRAAGTGRDYAYMRALGHLPVLLHPAPKRVAVMCLGTGTTLGAAFLHDEVEAIDVLEISPAVVEAAPWFLEVNHAALEPGAGSRVHVRSGDGRRLLADSPGAFDVVTMEPLLPDSPFGVYLYTREFYALAARSLAPGGLLCQWVPPHALEPRVFEAVIESFSRSFPWSGRFLFGTQLVLIGAAAEPLLDPARFPAPGSALWSALSEVNLEQPGGVLTTFRGVGNWPAEARVLSDDAPWIVFEDKPADARVFDWLGANLARVEQLAVPASSKWISAVGPGADRFVRTGALLAGARIEAAEYEARLRRAAGLQAEPFENSKTCRELASMGEGGKLSRAMLDEQRFLAHLRAGVAAITLDPRSAVDRLLSAAELRPERADVHLYVAAALQRLGSARGAAAALARALELCPRALETPAGRRAAGFGLPSPGR